MNTTALPRLVLDTNVVLDLLHYADARALPILQAVEAGQAVAVTDEAALYELSRVVTYPTFHLTPEAGTALVARYRALAEIHPAGDTPPLPRCKDPDDQKFLELALRCGADFLVSKDNALLRLKGRTRLPYAIVTPQAAADSLIPSLPD